MRAAFWRVENMVACTPWMRWTTAMLLGALLVAGWVYAVEPWLKSLYRPAQYIAIGDARLLDPEREYAPGEAARLVIHVRRQRACQDARLERRWYGWEGKPLSGYSTEQMLLWPVAEQIVSLPLIVPAAAHGHPEITHRAVVLMDCRDGPYAARLPDVRVKVATGGDSETLPN